MILNIYKIRDERVNRYGTPIFAAQEEDLFADSYKESVATLVANCERAKERGDDAAFAQLLGKLSELKDCALYKSGTFDNFTGEIKLHEDVLLFRLVDVCNFEVIVHE